MRAFPFVLVLAACHAVTARAPGPSPANHASPRASARTIAVLDRDGLFTLAPDDSLRRWPKVTGLSAEDWITQRGPYLMSGELLVDLRDLGQGTEPIENVYDGALRDEDVQVGDGPAGEVVVEDSSDTLGLRVDGVTRSFAWPAPGVNAFALAPDGATVAAVAGAEAQGPFDLYTLAVADGRFVRRTTTGDVYDVAFADAQTVVFATHDGFTYLDLHDGTTRIVRLPDTWDPGDLRQYRRTAPLLPAQREATSSTGLFDPDTGVMLVAEWDETPLAIAPDRKAAMMTAPCNGTGELVEVRADGTRHELRRAPEARACIDPVDHLAPRPSATYLDDGTPVYAIPGGAGWELHVGETVITGSPGAIAVFGSP